MYVDYIIKLYMEQCENKHIPRFVFLVQIAFCYFDIYEKIAFFNYKLKNVVFSWLVYKFLDSHSILEIRHSNILYALLNGTKFVLQLTIKLKIPYPTIVMLLIQITSIVQILIKHNANWNIIDKYDLQCKESYCNTL